MSKESWVVLWDDNNVVILADLVDLLCNHGVTRQGPNTLNKKVNSLCFVLGHVWQFPLQDTFQGFPLIKFEAPRDHFCYGTVHLETLGSCCVNSLFNLAFSWSFHFFAQRTCPGIHHPKALLIWFNFLQLLLQSFCTRNFLPSQCRDCSSSSSRCFGTFPLHVAKNNMLFFGKIWAKSAMKHTRTNCHTKMH